MSREIRRVLPDWKHPLEDREQLVVRDTSSLDGFRQAFAANELQTVRSHKPLLDESLREAQEQWDRELAEFRASGKGGEEAFTKHDGPRPPQWEDGEGAIHDGADWYRPEWPDETRTAFQVYETVTEGTPVSPVLESEEDLVTWLADPERDDERLPRMSKEAARRFVQQSWVPSMMVSDGRILMNVETLEPEVDEPEHPQS